MDLKKIKLVAIGSAHLDVIAKSTGDERCVDQPGLTTIEVGGTACNVAINWARMGAQAHLVTAIDGGMISSMVVDHCKKQGVVVHTENNPLLGAGVFSAHLDSQGDLMSAISHMPVEEHEFSTDFLDIVLDDADYVLLDCNLSSSELNNLALECLARGIPFCIAGVSEEKALRMQSVRSMPTLISMNLKEAKFFNEEVIESDASEPMEYISEVCDFMRAPCIVTMGERGAVYFSEEETPIYEKPEEIKEDGNRLGAGDGFLAAFILAVVMGATHAAALKRATRVGGLIASKSIANLGRNQPLEEAFADLAGKAYTDPLTGLNNRLGVKEGLDKRRKTSEGSFPLGVILFDVDYFKKVNDTLGHDVGDQALQNVSMVLQQALRSQDIAARWGGEEFIAFISSTSYEEVLLVAERIRSAVENAKIIEDWQVTVSLGVSIALEECALDKAIKAADSALYVSKQTGRNKVSFRSSIDERDDESNESWDEN